MSSTVTRPASAVLVDHHRQISVRLLHLFQQTARGYCFRNEVDRPHERRYGRVALLPVQQCSRSPPLDQPSTLSIDREKTGSRECFVSSITSHASRAVRGLGQSDDRVRGVMTSPPICHQTSKTEWINSRSSSSMILQLRRRRLAPVVFVVVLVSSSPVRFFQLFLLPQTIERAVPGSAAKASRR